MTNFSHQPPGYPPSSLNGSAGTSIEAFLAIQTHSGMQRLTEMVAALLAQDRERAMETRELMMRTRELRHALSDTEDRITAALEARQAAAPSTPPPAPPTLLQGVTDLCKAALPLAKVLLAVMALGSMIAFKFIYPDTLPVVRELIAFLKGL